MKAVGVVVEYNPFHNGHAFHVTKSKQVAKADVAIAVMSGPFLQRGEPALLSKYSRAKMALSSGVDIVIELPYRYAVQKAEAFARGAVSLLQACGCDSICFGSESGNIALFHNTIQFLTAHDTIYQEAIKKFMKTGVSYPRACSLAFTEISHSSDLLDLAKPNNILGFHYVLAINDLAPNIRPYTIKRKNAQYHDTHLPNVPIASATSIRKSILEHEDLENIRSYVPGATYTELQNYIYQYKQFHTWENYWPLIQYRLLTTPLAELSHYYEVEEGIEHRLVEAAHTASNFHQFLSSVKTKRYTWTRLQRICVHLLTMTKRDSMLNHTESPTYIRLLGMTETGRQYLNKQKKHVPLPIISKVSAFPSQLLEDDLRASRVYALGAKEEFRAHFLKMEYAQPPVYVNQ